MVNVVSAILNFFCIRNMMNSTILWFSADHKDELTSCPMKISPVDKPQTQAPVTLCLVFKKTLLRF